MSRIIITHILCKYLKNLTFHFLNNAFAIVLFAIMSKESLSMFSISEEHSSNPFEMFSIWFEEAKNTKEIHDGVKN